MKYATEKLVKKARQLARDIEAHNEMYEQDTWDGFAGANGLDDADLDRIREKVASRARVLTIKMSDVRACPRKSMLPSHYFNDGTCRCK